MAERTFCDRCGDEIVPVKGERTQWKLTLVKEEHELEGGAISTTDEIEKDLCDGCTRVVKKILAEAKVKA